MQRTALITGITGQDGSYLAEFLLARGYSVHGLVRRSSGAGSGRIAHLLAQGAGQAGLTLHTGDLLDGASLARAIEAVAPDELYNLAAQSHVQVSFEQPAYTADVTALGVVRLLEALRAHHARGSRPVRLYQAGSSEMFGNAPPRQSETTAFQPRSPYACAKVHAHHQVLLQRESQGLFACNGILFNHESPRRAETFVTRKITRAAARIKLGLQRGLTLGNLDVRRDWGFAGDYVEAMWRMLQEERPGDWCICTGVSHSLRELLELAFGGLDLDWREHVVSDPGHFRPADPPHLEGDGSRARRLLGWEPRTSFAELVAMMVAADLELARAEARSTDPAPAAPGGRAH